MEIDALQEQYIIKKCKRGDRKAFNRLMDMYQGKIFNFAYRISNNYDEASDITQEAFIRAFNSIKTFRNDASFSSWMYKIVKNVFLDRRKVSIKHQHVSIDEKIQTEDGGIQRDPKDDSATPEEELMLKEKSRMFMEMLSTLPEHHRIAIVLYHMNGLGYEEIAKITDTPIGTVKSRINRARATIYEKLKENKELLGK